MIPDAILIGALWIGTVSLIAYWCWTDARKDEGARYRGEGRDD